MSKPDSKRLVQTLLKNYGQTFTEELGRGMVRNMPSDLFCLLIASLLLSARIRHTTGLEACRLMLARGWTTPEALAKTTWRDRVEVLDDAGYVRYDERTSTMLGDAVKLLLERYQGDLRKLRDAAKADPARERELLKEFKGIGDVGADIFCREAQLAWPELFPFADAKVLEGAKSLGLPASADQLLHLVRGRVEFVRLVAALIRVKLRKNQEEVLARAA
mgnify:FL=1